MSDEKTTTTKQSSKAQKKDKTELWISRGFSDHMITISNNGAPAVVKFANYKYECDLSSEEGRSTSEGLHNSTREGRDIFVVGEAYDTNDIGSRTEMLKKLRDMTVQQLRSLLTIDEMLGNNVPANTVDTELLITLIMKLKSL